MSVDHLEFLVEEPSMEAFLRTWLPQYLPVMVSFDVKIFQGKSDLLGKLEARLRAYVAWIPASWRLMIVMDRDDDDCRSLKAKLEGICTRAGMRTRRSSGANWQGVTCIAIEELEAWYFGDWAAVCEAYPRLSPQIPRQSSFRYPDAISGGTWEAFERVLQKKRYFSGGLQKVRAAREIGQHIDARRNISPSFVHLVRAIDEATG